MGDTSAWGKSPLGEKLATESADRIVGSENFFARIVRENLSLISLSPCICRRRQLRPLLETTVENEPRIAMLICIPPAATMSQMAQRNRLLQLHLQMQQSMECRPPTDFGLNFGVILGLCNLWIINLNTRHSTVIPMKKHRIIRSLARQE